MKVILTVKAPELDRRWKSWAKTVTRIDQTKSNGFAFEGQWLTLGRKAELEVGSLVLVYAELGSAKYRTPSVWVRKVTPEGALETVLETQGPDWALELRDKVAAMLPQEG